MARVLVVQHTAGEGLGRFADWLPAVGLDVHPIHPYLGHRVPSVVEGDALIVLGGPMSAYDDTTAPWLPATRDLLRNAVEDGVPTLGICLGAQLLATAAGGEVSSPGGAGPELGLGTVDVAEPGDELLLAGPMPVVQWHYDAVTKLPDDTAVLAGSVLYPHQAFRVGELAWGVQFHPEATVEMVTEWAVQDAASVRGLGREPADVAAELAAADPRLAAAGESLAQRFAAIVTG